ncbi:MAG: hypothetical protein JSR34_07180 [Proteobacteria bacterium]|nr:hypothetical protein [Pseudomonadota bacterium]
MKRTLALASCLALAACSHLSMPHIGMPHFPAQPVSGTVVGVVEYDTGLTTFSTVSGHYHQDMCSSAKGDADVHLSDKEMRKILAQAEKDGFYTVPADLTTTWSDPARRPPHCANFRLHIAAGDRHNEARWDCGADGSNTPPAPVAPLVRTIQQILRSRKEVSGMPWSSCPVR